MRATARRVLTAAGAAALLALVAPPAWAAPGDITTVAGGGPFTPDCNNSGDGLPATQASFFVNQGVTADDAGNIYVADSGCHVIRRVDPLGIITRFSGDGTLGFSGDGQAASAARLGAPIGLAFDARRLLVIGDSFNNRVRAVNLGTSPVTAWGVTIPGGAIATVAGDGTRGGPTVDGGAATGSQVEGPNHLAVDGLGNLYVVEIQHRVRQVDASGTITTVAGTGTSGFNGDDRPATTAQLNAPHGLAVSPDGKMLFIPDRINNRLRAVNLGPAEGTVLGVGPIQPGHIKTVAGSGAVSSTGDGGPATAAGVNQPAGVALDPSGAVFVGQDAEWRVRKVSPAGIISLVAGSGASRGDGGPATSAKLRSLRQIALDPAGHLLICDADDTRIRRVEAAGTPAPAPPIPEVPTPVLLALLALGAFAAAARAARRRPAGRAG